MNNLTFISILLVFFSKSAMCEWKYVDKIKKGFFDTSVTEYYYEPDSIKVNSSKVTVKFLVNEVKQNKLARSINKWKSSVIFQEIQCKKNNKGDIWVNDIYPSKLYDNLMANGDYNLLDLRGRKVYIKFENSTIIAKYVCEKYVS